jgi:hypothetical protein
VSSQRVSSGCRLALTLLVPSILVSGCGQSGGVTERAGDTGLHQDKDEPRIQGLTCSTKQRSMGIFDHFSNSGGAESPEAAVKPMVGTDEVVVEESAEGGAAVWVLRTDGTAHTRLGLRQFADGTWVVEETDSCSGATGLLPRSRGR